MSKLNPTAPTWADGYDENNPATWPVVDEPAVAPEPRKTFPLLTIDELENLPPLEYLFEPYLLRNSLACLYGPYGTAKSFFGFHVGAKLAVGGCNVLYIAGENVEGMAERSIAWRLHNKAKPSSLYTVPLPVKLNDEAEMNQLLATIYDKLPGGIVDLIVVDTLSRSLAGVDENSSKDTAITIDFCDQLRRATCACVLLIHHTPLTDGKRMRGSSVIPGACDTLINTEANRDKTIFTVSITKQRNRKPAPPLNFRLIEVAFNHPQDGRLVVSAAYEEIPADELPPEPNHGQRLSITLEVTLRAVANNYTPGSGRGARNVDIATAVGISKSAVSNQLAVLSGKGYVARLEGSGGWLLTDEGRSVLGLDV